MTKPSRISLLLPIAIIALTQLNIEAKEVARFSMENSAGMITEKISGATYAINSVHDAENMPGAEGNALRFDGYSTYIDASVGNIIPAGSRKMTASIWFAIETYPIVEIDVNTAQQVAIASCIDESAKTGFGFFIGFDGKYSFKTYVGGWPLEMKVDSPLNQYEWINLVAVIDGDARTATLYNNATQVASSKANGNVTVANSTMRIGRSFNERLSGPFCLTSFNGLIDDIAIWDEALDANTISSWIPENSADLTIPASRFAENPMRPAFHGMPGANWTNETHGMIYSNNRFHLFFQKNANGPFMSRLHWGHLSSENLYDWNEEQIALTPGTSFDMKGCWSGCVFSDNELTDGNPSIIYTGVDYNKAVIAQATPEDNNLISWSKKTMPLINGRPAGLSDDFRDPYFFRTDNGAYIIVGSSKGGVGTTTLHTYNPALKTWSNDGKTFFTGTSASTCGTFWEMPNVTHIGDKWLFTVTPQNTFNGVAALYWVGTINADGTFSPDKTNPTNIELPGFARDGYGLLSPTIYQHEGKTIALGIVPDKLPSQDNYDLGFAHTYSLPREWSIDSNGNLCQKPYSGLSAMRVGNGFSRSNFTLDGSLSIDDISGREIEISGEFTVTTGKCGFTILDDGAHSVKIYYDGATNEIIVDARSVDRLSNDAGVFDGYYHSSLPRQLAKGETIKLNIFFDHSILDIFINDTWASSVRIFANSGSQENVTAFTEGANQVKSINGWVLNKNNATSGTDRIVKEVNTPHIAAEAGILQFANINTPATITVYNLAGKIILSEPITTPSGHIKTPLHGFHLVTVRTPNQTTTQKLIL